MNPSEDPAYVKAYQQHRARARAYGLWHPWEDDPDRVRAHVKSLRADGATYDAISQASGVATATIHALVNAGGRLKADTAVKLMAVTSVAPAPRYSVSGTRLRMRSLVAMGHSGARQGRALGMHPETARRIISGDASSVSKRTYRNVIRLWNAWWNKTPSIRTREEHGAAVQARLRAERRGWCNPASLEADNIDMSGYNPRTAWKPAAGTGVADDYPLGHLPKQPTAKRTTAPPR